MNTKRSNLKKVAEGICDSAASESFESNTESFEAVQAYAENGLAILLTDEQAEKVRDVCLRAAQSQGENELFYIMKELD